MAMVDIGKQNNYLSEMLEYKDWGFVLKDLGLFGGF